ncbi:MAG: HAD hydrolase-like protein [Acidimicrobiales bacterium]|jgi:phosphoglycolate phosphatase
MSSLPDYVIFDLDGTIADSQEGILYSFRLTLDEFGVTRSDDELRDLIGPPLEESFRSLGFVGDALEPAIERYRDYYGRLGVQKARLYDGVFETLRVLDESDVRLAVATAKRVDFAHEMLEALGVASFFQTVVGVSFDDSLTTKKQVINEVLEFFRPPQRRRVWMVGDRQQDILASIFHGLVPIGVLWGYGSRDELDTSGAEYIIEDPRDLLELGVDTGGGEPACFANLLCPSCGGVTGGASTCASCGLVISKSVE